MPQVCPTPEKLAYESRSAAKFFADADGLRPYPCRCGKWHLTSEAVERFRKHTKRGRT